MASISKGRSWKRHEHLCRRASACDVCAVREKLRHSGSSETRAAVSEQIFFWLADHAETQSVLLLRGSGLEPIRLVQQLRGRK